MEDCDNRIKPESIRQRIEEEERRRLEEEERLKREQERNEFERLRDNDVRRTFK